MTKPAIKTFLIEQCNNCGSEEFLQIADSNDFEYETCCNNFKHVQCQNCGLIFLYNRPDLSTLPIIYPKQYRPYQFKKVLNPTVSKIRDLVQKNKINTLKKYAKDNSFIIDVGCGSGTLLNLIKKYGYKSWALGGVDISEDSIDLLHLNGIKGYLGRFESMHWTAPMPDIIIMNQVIEHLDDPYAVTQKAFELLKPGGHFIIETPSVDGLDAKWFKNRYWGGWHTPRHWTLYSEKTLSYLLKKIGFGIEEISYLLSPTFWLQSLHHYTKEELNSKRIAILFDNKFLPSVFFATIFDLTLKIIYKKTSNLRIVARKPL